MNFEPIGTYHSDAKAPYEAARQPLDRIATIGEIRLQPGQQFEQALEDLEGIERLWLIYVFHHNTTHWKPKVLPPRGSDKKVGVFATRAPYRPNPIGMSCVKLLKIDGLKIYVEGADLLDGSPILDIKPYLPYADAFPESKTGWLGTPQKYAVLLSQSAREQIDFLKSRGVSQLEDFILNQLEYDPTNSDKKRVVADGDDFVLAYKTWRIRFSLNEEKSEITVKGLFSGYSEADLAETADPYADKNTHKEFLRRF
ncbi:MAG: tRNA (N6-threonylcarbamoyladenosine(37)-N6)-methyltransferase TrmO [Bdellovibrionales bacterium]|nr:tRNA (N6-threonylcarbamoyladenosine(37)-N6)-methyltransferase TrmO [Bdellovibrionales bacterium]